MLNRIELDVDRTGKKMNGNWVTRVLFLLIILARHTGHRYDWLLTFIGDLRIRIQLIYGNNTFLQFLSHSKFECDNDNANQYSMPSKSSCVIHQVNKFAGHGR